MIDVLKYTYLLDVSKINKSLEDLWTKYEAILKKPNWEDLNEARAILYFIGYIYCEQIAEEAIERRLHLLKKPLNLLDFYSLVDSQSSQINEYRKDPLFVKLEDYYNLIKKNKNRFTGGKFYMDEEKFIKLYNEYNPNKDLKIKERGKFDK